MHGRGHKVGIYNHQGKLVAIVAGRVKQLAPGFTARDITMSGLGQRMEVEEQMLGRLVPGSEYVPGESDLFGMGQSEEAVFNQYYGPRFEPGNETSSALVYQPKQKGSGLGVFGGESMF